MSKNIEWNQLSNNEKVEFALKHNWPRVAHKQNPFNVRKWLDDNVKTRYVSRTFIFYFENINDAVRFKLQFGGNL